MMRCCKASPWACWRGVWTVRALQWFNLKFKTNARCPTVAEARAVSMDEGDLGGWAVAGSLLRLACRLPQPDTSLRRIYPRHRSWCAHVAAPHTCGTTCSVRSRAIAAHLTHFQYVVRLRRERQSLCVTELQNFEICAKMRKKNRVRPSHKIFFLIILGKKTLLLEKPA